MNLGICSKCKKVVEVTHSHDSGKEYLEKKCPECGVTRELISNDSSEYRRKRMLMADKHYPGCNLECLECDHKLPNIIFIETTNRCNMNCPICITNVPSMGFEFEPNMEYFDRIFKYYASFEFPPSVQLFGGEPTMREDIFDIIDLARSYGLSVRLVTNGLKLADQTYCDKMMSSGASVLIAFDGLKVEMYEKLRNFPGSLDLKLKALENISRHKKGKVVLMTVIDKEMNGEDMPRFLEYCRDHLNIIRGIFLMPLSQVWDESRLEYEPDRTTQEDVEKLVGNAVNEPTEFIPLGSMEFKNIARIFKIKHMPFMGVHPNCESFTLLVKSGNTFHPINRYLKKGFSDIVGEIKHLDETLEGKHAKNIAAFSKFITCVKLLKIFLSHINFAASVGTRGIKTLGIWISIILASLTGKKFKHVIKEKAHIDGILQVLLLPFEDDYTLESERLEKCAACFAYIDVKDDKIKSIPFCIWEKYKKSIMKEMSEKYNIER